MMGIFTSRFRTTLFFFSILFFTSPDFLRSQNAPIRPAIADTLQTIGREFTINIRVGSEQSGVENLFGVSFVLRYNPDQYLTIVRAAGGGFMGEDVVFFSFEDPPNSIAIANTRKAGQDGVSGNGVVASVTFVSSADTPDCTPVEFEIDSINAIDVNGNSVAFTPERLTIELQPEPDFAVQTAPETLRIVAGAADSFAVSLAANCAMTSDAALSADFPPNVVKSVSFSLATLFPGETTTGLVTTLPDALPGVYPVSVSADAENLTRSDTLFLEIPARPDFVLSASPKTQTVRAGDSAIYQVFLETTGGFNDDVNLTIQALPQGASAGFSPQILTPPDSATLNLTTAPTAPAGVFPLIITGASAEIVRSDTVSLNIVSRPDFALNVSPLSQTVRAGETAVYEISIQPTPGFSNSVALAFSGLDVLTLGAPELLPQTIRGGETAQFTVPTSSRAQPATYLFDIIATSAEIAHDTTASLIVEAPETGVRPNPFTPNGDGFNDDVRFNIPGLLDGGGEVVIHNFRGKRVRRLVGQNRWDGKDDNGKNLPPGLYLYFVKINGVIEARGSVTLIR